MKSLSLILIILLQFACAPVASEFMSVDPFDDPPDDDMGCYEGKRLGVWLDLNGDGSIEGEKYLGEFISYTGPKTAKENYNYYSASAHPLVGPVPKGFKTTVFFYEGPDGLSFNFFNNIDAGGSEDNIVEWNIVTKGNLGSDNVILSDDNMELTRVSTSTVENHYEGRFHYWLNTDGGVIGPFSGENFFISVKVLNAGDIIDAGFYSANGDVLPLSDGAESVSSFIVGFKGYQICD